MTMTPTADRPSPHRATILVGYGDFGLETQRRLLATAGPRGVLTWEEPDAGTSDERRLQELALLWLPDRPRELDDTLAGNDLEMLRDLYRQIVPISLEGELEANFAEKLATTAEILLSAAARAGKSQLLPLGLDVIVLARPESREELGTLDRLLVRGMERLANNANLERAVQSAEVLNFIAIYDFENYWDRSDRGYAMRRALYTSIEQWQKRRTANQPAFGRFYLVDGRTDDGFRAAVHRVDEVTLLLELLLFEGQRDGELQRLYQSLGRLESPVATFGIRLMERSAGLLSHLAAARFGVGWLDYLAGTGPYQAAAEPMASRKQLAEYGPDALDALLNAASLETIVNTELSALERELAPLSSELPDWARRVRSRYDETVRRLEVRLSQRARELMADVASRRLVNLPGELKKGVDADLHNETDPVPIGRIITELDEALERVDPGKVVVPPEEEPEQVLRELESLHGDYRAFQWQRVHVEGLKNWWPWLAVVLAAGVTPIVRDLLSEIHRPDPLQFALNRAFDILQWLNNPVVVGGVLFLLVWLIGATALQPRIAARIHRARRFYTDDEQGRFIDRLRRGLATGGALRAPIDAHVERLLLDMRLSVRGEVTRELKSVLHHLQERKREMLWLSAQLRQFLRMNNFTGADLRPESGRLVRDGSGIRYAVEQREDFEKALAANPPVPERFRSMQASQAPFDGWSERYSRTFLAPLEFLDRLSPEYTDPFEQELARPGVKSPQDRLGVELRHFLAQYGTFSLAFNFKAQAPPDRRYCLLPPLWRRIDGIRADLADVRIPEEAVLSGADGGRAYLLRVQTGVEPKCVVEPD